MHSFKFLHDAISHHGLNNFTFKDNNKSNPVSWLDLQRHYMALANGFLNMDLPKNPIIGILSSTRYEWTVSDFAIQAIEGVTVGLYKNDRDSVISHCLSQASPDLLILETNEDLKRIQSIDPDWGWTKPVVIMHSGLKHSPPIYDFNRIINEDVSNNKINEILTIINNQDANRISSYIFTSGTSGTPKTTVLSSNNLIHSAISYYDNYNVDNNDSTILYLPFSHVFSRVMFYASILWGQEHYYISNIDDLAGEMQRINPSVMLVVPRLLEKVREKILEKVSQKNLVKSLIFNSSISIGKSKNLNNKKSIITNILYSLADKLVLTELRHIFGTKVKFLGAGGGRLNKNTSDFFWSIGLPVYEGYASTESGGLGIFNNPKNSRNGSIGIAPSTVDWKLADDSELLLNSPSNALGYLENGQISPFPQWLSTGDIAAVDQDGFISIKDRKKDIFVTAYGKNISPGWIEEQFSSSTLIEDVTVAGDERAYLTALIVPSDTHKEKDDLHQLIQAEVHNINKNLSRHETIKSFKLIDSFTIDASTMTSTFKKRRNAILEYYKNDIDTMYENSKTPKQTALS